MKNSYKKIYIVIIVISMLSVLISGCGNISADNDKLTVVTTIFPEYDWVMNILGEKADDTEVTMLLNNGVDLHSYQPTADDIIKISTCDVFIYVGGESDKWVDDVLKNAVNKDMTVINLLDLLGNDIKEEEIVEGMQEKEHDHHEDEHEDEHEEGPEYDEHVWLSIRNAVKLCREIAGRLSEKDPENKDIYTANLETYIKNLNALDEKYQTALSNTKKKTLLFGDRFPFRYLTDDYGLDYYAAFAGCSAETEASFETIVFLANKADELGLNAIIHIESSDGKIATTIKENTKTKDQKIIVLDSLQATTLMDREKGTNYISVMEKNLEAITEALS